ncbi:MAG: tetratricopeptide repeat protein [Chthoniobacterales bacterium]
MRKRKPTKSGKKTSNRVNHPGSQLITAGICVFLVAIVWMSFSGALGSDFVNFDDNHYVYGAPHVAGGLTPGAIGWAFTHVHAANWHPLTTISHMLDCEIYGLQPWGHHLSNILLQAAAAILLFLALRKLTLSLWPSAFVATIFAVHPLRVESVAWISERKDVLSGVFFMLTLLAYARYARSARFSLGRYLTVIVFFALGLLCKPTLVSLPFVLLLLDYWPLQRMQSVNPEDPKAKNKSQRSQPTSSILRRLIIEKIPFFVLSAISCVVTFIAQKGALNATQKVVFPERLANAVISYVAYLAQTIWPVHLAVLYPFREHDFTIWRIVFALLLLSLILIVVWIYRKPFPFLLVGWFWFLGALVPMSGIIQVGWQSRADRYTYLPQIGLLLAITWGVTELIKKMPQHRRLVAVGVAVITLSLVLRTRAQTSIWKNSVTLWQNAVENTPNNYVAYNNLGEALVAEEKFDRAATAFEKAIQINGSMRQAEYNLGNVFVRQHNLPDAIAHYQRALQIKLDYAEAECNLCNALLQSGEPSLAIYHCEKAVALKPDSFEVQINLANAFLTAGETSQAREHYRKAVVINSDSAEMQCLLGDGLASTGDVSGAISCYQSAARLEPRNAKVHNDVGLALAKLGKTPEAVAELQQALQIDPDYAEAEYNIGSLLARLGRKQEAATHLVAALRLKPDYVDAKEQLRELGLPSLP